MIMWSSKLRYCLVIAGVLVPAAVWADITVMDEIICKVNGDIVTRSELDKDRQELPENLRQQSGGALTGQALEDAVKKNLPDLLRQRIDDLLLEQRAKEMDIKVDTEVNKFLADVQRRAKIADPDKFQAFIRDNMGMPFEDYRGQIKNQYLQRRVVEEEVSRKIAFKREELEAYYNDHKEEFRRDEQVVLSEILISTAGLDAAGQTAAEKKAKDLVARANKGDNFADLASQNSDAGATASEGGQLPPYAKKDLNADMAALIWDKSKGFVTDPIKIDQGYLILRVDDHQKAGVPSFEEIQGDVQARLFQPRFVPALRAYLTKLREQAFLEIKPGYVDTGAAPNKDTTWVDPAQLKPETIKKEEILAQTHHKRLLGFIPLPGTSAPNTGTSSSH